MILGTLDQFQRALAKAQSKGGARLVTQVQPDVFEVPSSDGTSAYAIWSPRAGDYRCTCLAAQHSAPCFHVAAVYLLQVSELSRGQSAATSEEG